MTPRALLAALLLVAAFPTAAAAGERRSFVPDEVIVKFKPGVGRGDVLRDHQARNLKGVTSRMVLTHVADVREAVRAFKRDPRVEWAQPNTIQHGGGAPNDAFYGEQWELRHIGLPAAWQRTTGAPAVKIAVVDSGIAFDQPDLAPNIWHNPGESGGGREDNGVDDDGNGFVDDWRGWDFVQPDNDPSDNHGHGTHVAGIAAARGDDGTGMAGIAWRSSIVPVRVLDNSNAGTCANLAAGLAYAVRIGARVVNGSFGGGPCLAERDVIGSAPNTLFVVSAMNDGVDVDTEPAYPCAFGSPNIVCVGATDQRDALAGFSNYGSQSVDLAAPGVHIFSTITRFGPRETVLADGFEAPLAGRWATGGGPDTWQRGIVYTNSGGWSLEDSPFGAYANNTDNFVWLPQRLDLSSRHDCALYYSVRWDLEEYDPGVPISDQDRLELELSSDGRFWDLNPARYVGIEKTFVDEELDLSQLEGHAAGTLRFRLVTNATGTSEGVAIDDVRVDCVPPLTDYSGARDEFEAWDGTSMAAPHVTGVAALMLAANPALTAVQVKQRLLAAVDRVPSLAGKTVSGGRLNAAKALAPAVATAPPPAAPADPAVAIAAVLRADLRTVARSIAATSRRAALRRGAFTARDLALPAPGRLTLKLKRGPRTFAAGVCSLERAGTCSLTARLNRRGKAQLRRGRVRVTAVLTFVPRSGAAVARRKTLTLGGSR
jgi:subtilisin family serine protease